MVSRIVRLLDQMQRIKDLLDFQKLAPVFDQEIAQRLLDISDFKLLTQVAHSSFQLSLPYAKIWAGLANAVLLQHLEMSDSQFVKLLWLLCKGIRSQDMLKLDLDLVRSGTLQRSKLMKRC